MSTQNKKIKDMTILELKEYLQARGVTVTGYLKPALVEIANAVQKMMLPLDPNFECRDDSERKLIIHENEIEDPFVNSHDALDYFNDSPPFGLYDIFNHLIYHTTDYDKQGLAAYKSFDDYRLFEEGYVESLRTKKLAAEGVHLYIGRVRPTMKEKTNQGKKFYDLWFILEGTGPNRGSVLKAKCRCKGGQDGGCKHIAATMYSLEETLNTRDKDSVTSAPCKWVKRPTASSKPYEIKDLVIGHQNSPTKRKNVKESISNSKVQNKKRKSGFHVYCENMEVDVRNEEDRNPPSPESCTKFIQSLSADGFKKPVLLPLLQKIYLPSAGTQSNVEIDSIKESIGGSDVNSIKEEVGCEHKENCPTKARIKDDESTTVKVNCEVPIMKKKLEDLLNENDNDVERVSSNIKNGNLFFTTEEIESTSSSTLKQWRCKEWFIQKSAKSAKEAFLTPEVGGKQVGDSFLLKPTSRYYHQVQLQMFVYNLMLCHLVVWTKLGVFVVKVPFNENFMNSVIAKLEVFWISHILPKMMLEIQVTAGLDTTTLTGKNSFIYNIYASLCYLLKSFFFELIRCSISK